MQDRMRVWEEEQAMKAAQHATEENIQMRDLKIINQLYVRVGDEEKTIATIREKLGPHGIDCKQIDNDDYDHGAATIDIWCEATPDYVLKLARGGFAALIERSLAKAGIGGGTGGTEYGQPRYQVEDQEGAEA